MNHNESVDTHQYRRSKIQMDIKQKARYVSQNEYMHLYIQA